MASSTARTAISTRNGNPIANAVSSRENPNADRMGLVKSSRREKKTRVELPMRRESPIGNPNLRMRRASCSSYQHTSSRVFVSRLRSGKWLLVKNGPIDKNAGRKELAACLSRDEGRTLSGGSLVNCERGVLLSSHFFS